MKPKIHQPVPGQLCWIVLVTFLAFSGLVPAQATVFKVLLGQDPQRAVLQARLLRVKNPAGRIVVEFAAGTHYLAKPLILAVEDSGTSALPLEIRGAPGATVTLSGGRPLRQLAWKPSRKGI